MPNSSDVEENNLVRLHPNEGGVTAKMDDQTFKGASPDAFFGLDIYDSSVVRVVTRKLNVNIDINPRLFPPADFFRYFTCGPSQEDPFKCGALKRTEKCEIHGDADTGLFAHPQLEELLNQANLKKANSSTLGFVVNKIRYEYDSVGVAANQGYVPVKTRPSSHLEIKFRVVSESNFHEERLCLNIHLHPKKERLHDKAAVFARLRAAIRLFYAELNVLSGAQPPQTRLRDVLTINLDNFEGKQFSCLNEKSVLALEKYRSARLYVAPSSSRNMAVLVEAAFSKKTSLSQGASGVVSAALPRGRVPPSPFVARTATRSYSEVLASGTAWKVPAARAGAGLKLNDREAFPALSSAPVKPKGP